MAKKRARKGAKRKDLDLDEAEGEESSPVRGPKKPRRRKRDYKRTSSGSGMGREYGLWGMVTAIAVIIILMFSLYAYQEDWWDLNKEDEDENDENVVSESGVYDIRLRILSDISHKFSSEAARDTHVSGKVTFLLQVENRGSQKTKVNLEASQPNGWTTKLDDSSMTVNKGANKMVILTVKPGEAVDVNDDVTVTVTAQTQEDAAASARVTAQVTARDLGNVTSKEGERVSLHYVLIDRGADAEFNADVWAVSQASYDSGDPFTATAGGSDTIPGFAAALVGMRPGETRCFMIESEDAYGNNKDDGKPDGDLYYEITLLEMVGD